MSLAQSIDRGRLAFLILCALFASTLGSFEQDTAMPALPSVSSPGVAEAVVTADGFSSASANELVATTPTAIERQDTPSNEEELTAQILKRLSMRHTGLPERERIALVQTILEEARLYDLDPGLVVAVIEVESAGYHLAVSHVGAMGLMQLLPATGKELAMRLGIDWHGDDTLFDPIINVRLGTAYLSQLHKRYGSVHTALAAYNWGPGRIDRRIRRGAHVPTGYPTKVMRAFDRNARNARNDIVLVSRS